MRKADRQVVSPSCALGRFWCGGWIALMSKVASVSCVVLCGRFPVKVMLSTLTVRVHWQHHTVRDFPGEKEKLPRQFVVEINFSDRYF